MSKTLTWAAEGTARPWRIALLHLVAATLRFASAGLDRAASSVTAAAAADDGVLTGVVEFHAVYRDAGAPEGAIFVDGKLYAVIPGVTRW